MGANIFQYKKIDNKLLVGGAIAIIFLIALPSIFTLAKIAVGLAILSVGIIAFKVALKAVSNTTKQNEDDDTRDKIINIVIGLTSILIGGLSVLIVAQTGIVAACAALVALVLHEYAKSDEKEAAHKDQSTNSGEKDGFVEMAEEGETIQSEEKSICSIIDEKLDEAASRIVKCATDLCVSGIEKLTPAKSPQAEGQQV